MRSPLRFSGRPAGAGVLPALAVVALAATLAGAESPPVKSQKTLPSLAAGGAGESARVQGEVRHSTRGRGRGAVRLDVLSDSGEAVAVLLVPDGVLDSLGLSYRAGERIDARGSLVPGKLALLVATEVTVDGRVVRLRGDPQAEGSGAREPPRAPEPSGPMATPP
jgi:hypothetical protein